MGGSGGAATHAGIDYQERIAALIMLQALAQTEDYDALQLDANVTMQALRFEAEHAIDDLVLETSRGRVFVQAKRSLQLSAADNSDFSSVVGQFVRQQIENEAAGDIYLLAVSPRSSQRITQELKHITDARRLNEGDGASNPSTKSERDTLAKTRALAQAHFLKAAAAPMPAEFFDRLLRKIRVARIDIEAGSSLEAAALLVVSCCSNLPPVTVWSTLIAFAISLAKERLSVDRAGLTARMGHLFQPKAEAGTSRALDGSTVPFEFAGRLSAGRDLLLVEPIEGGDEHIVFELFRFDDDGSRRLRYAGSEVEFLNGTKFRVVRRTSSFMGMQRALTEEQLLPEGAKLLIAGANDTDDVEDQPFVTAHRLRCEQLLAISGPSLRCMRCGDPISEASTPSIEIDQEDAELQVGLCHKDCVQPLDRVLGIIQCDLFERNRSLKNFDYVQWFRLAPRGQGLFQGGEQLRGVKRVLWNPGNGRASLGQWCVRMELADGSGRYVHERGRVARCGEAEAQGQASTLNENLRFAKAKNDPWCYTSPDDMFTTHDAAIQHLGPDTSVIECISATPVRYTASIGSSYSHAEGYYTPLMMLIERDSGRPVFFSDGLFLLTDPLSVDKHLENWRRAGFDIPNFVISIVASDAEFDSLKRQMESERIAVLVDPFLDAEGELARGYIIDNYDEVVRDAPATAGA